MAPRKVFEQGLLELRQDIITMGTELEVAVGKTIQAIINGDPALAEEVRQGDDKFDLREVEIEKKCVALIMHQQPIAHDLRFIMSILKIVTDMERIADQCEDICTYSLQLQDGEWSKEVAYKRHIERMATDVQQMINMTIDSFVQKDVEKLRMICQFDDKIDAEFKRIWHELVDEMNKSTDFARQGAEYIMIIKYFERIADHTTNIAEWLIYNLTGEYAKKLRNDK
ncbi:MAG: phosphate signaling complex protein PhoU [Cellulosilyticaceae bacterium]